MSWPKSNAIATWGSVIRARLNASRRNWRRAASVSRICLGRILRTLIACAKHHSHAAGANLFDDTVMAKHLANGGSRVRHSPDTRLANYKGQHRSEERRVGKEGRSRWSPYH